MNIHRLLSRSMSMPSLRVFFHDADNLGEKYLEHHRCCRAGEALKMLFVPSLDIVSSHLMYEEPLIDDIGHHV